MYRAACNGYLRVLAKRQEEVRPRKMAVAFPVQRLEDPRDRGLEWGGRGGRGGGVDGIRGMHFSRMRGAELHG